MRRIMLFGECHVGMMKIYLTSSVQHELPLRVDLNLEILSFDNTVNMEKLVNWLDLTF